MGGMRVVLEDSVRGLVCSECNSVSSVDVPNLPGLLAAVAIGRQLKT
jgi:hypothetical protein